ncbi:MAG: hydroxyacid dehydrogenase [Gammaproteobacteria bacterium]|nr:hydroxyacid dehydrogenase [Gammaproteobacteria bacterium]NIR82105.1 hydroxyacid dehydrogenase [Gammaproteobacteria bacterium]NIR89338.1 hydroxyacid dehydrogenase [Gammaproteobacteria bacterium]NIU03215.1 hydroxyacid dehydrogenase [Gammaproteobacteria bacterium]NIV74510.1 hydroxyacid dehydrogenase [Gammaproteobacteria bacterium]
MKILFADKFQEQYLEKIEGLGHECVLRPELKEGDLPAEIAGYDALIVRSTLVTSETIEASDRLALIIRAGAGTNTIDKQAAADRGICVCNVPGKNAIAVAELALGLVLAVDRRIPDNVIDLREGQWNKKRYAEARGLYGRRIGVVGIGEIGLAVAERAHAFGLEVHVLRKRGRRPDAEARLAAIDATRLESLEELAETCDILTFHVPAGADTRGLIGRELLAHVKPGAFIINTARGEIVDDDALIEAMDEKGIRAGLDVYNEEPSAGEAEFHGALAQHPNVYGTHHIGASTEQAQNAIAARVVRILEAFDAGTVLHCVNMETQALGTVTLSVRHYDRVGVLAQVFDVLRNAHINVEQMQNQIFAGGHAACATMQVSGDVTPEVVFRLEAIADVISLSVKERRKN